LAESEVAPDLLRSIATRSRAHENVKLLADGSALFRKSGIGRALTDLLIRNDFPVETTRIHHPVSLTKNALETEAASVDRLVILGLENWGGIPGTIRIQKGPGSEAKNVSVFVQPDPKTANSASFEPKVEQGLAQNLFELLTQEAR
jgi:hypothetical protein